MTKKLRYILCAIMICAIAFTMVACGSKTEESKAEKEPVTEASDSEPETTPEEETTSEPDTTESSSSTDTITISQLGGDSLYQEVLFNNPKNLTVFLTEAPTEWKAEDQNGILLLSKNGSGTIPFISVEELGWGVKSPEGFITDQAEAFKKKYGNQMAMPPELSDTTVAGMPLSGFTAKYSADDGSGTITRIEYIEVINDLSYHFVCEYLSSASGDQHEDETTYFEFMHVIESLKIQEG